MTFKFAGNDLLLDRALDGLDLPSPRFRAKSKRRAHHKSQRNRPSGAGSIPTCPYCRNRAKLVTGDVLYPHRPDLHHMKFWQCAPCDAYVGTHQGKGERPLGRLANAELRAAKQEAHRAFDPLWRSGANPLRRKEAYAWLAEQLDIDVKDCHIGMFDVAQCKAVVSICEGKV